MQRTDSQTGILPPLQKFDWIKPGGRRSGGGPYRKTVKRRGFHNLALLRKIKPTQIYVAKAPK